MSPGENRGTFFWRDAGKIPNFHVRNGEVFLIGAFGRVLLFVVRNSFRRCQLDIIAS
jgi:hypothetical protein